MDTLGLSQTDLGPEESLCLILGGNPRDMDAGRVARAVHLLTALVRSFTPTSDKAKIGVMRGGDSGMEVLSSAAISREILAGIATIEKESVLPRNWTLAQVKIFESLRGWLVQRGSDLCRFDRGKPHPKSR